MSAINRNGYSISTIVNKPKGNSETRHFDVGDLRIQESVEKSILSQATISQQNDLRVSFSEEAPNKITDFTISRKTTQTKFALQEENPNITVLEKSFFLKTHCFARENLIYKGPRSNIFSIRKEGKPYVIKCTTSSYNWGKEISFFQENKHQNIIQLIFHQEKLWINSRNYNIQVFCKYQVDLFCYISDAQKNKTFGNKEYLRSIKTIAKAVLNGLEYIGENGFVHRDIKDENVLLDLSDLNHSVISDFEFCVRSSEIIDEEDSIKGTLVFLPPEVLKSKISRKWRYYASPSEDMWSFGNLLYNAVFSRELISIDEKNESFSGLIEEIEKITDGKEYCLPNQLVCDNGGLIDLLKSILKIDPEERIRASNALKHTYLMP